MNHPAGEPSGRFHTAVEEIDLAVDPLPPPPPAFSSAQKNGFPARHALPTLPGFEILCELGRGGMGRVFKARQIKLNRIVAIKMMHVAEFAIPEEREQFLREAQALAALQHPHIVQIFEVGEDRERAFLVMECLDGGSLDKRLRGQVLPCRTAAAIVETLARAVDYVHQRGLLHRDLKLANVLVATDPESALEPGKVKLTDFGLAKPLVSAAASTEVSHVIAGTPNYMAPEQAVGKPASAASDVYSLGVILYELMTGRPPFSGSTLAEVLTQVVGTDPTPPRRLVPSLPRDLETICLKCLRKDPTQRYRSAGELTEDLQRFGNGLPIHARPVGPIERVRKWARRRPAIATLCAILAVSILTGVSLVTWKWQQALSANAIAERNHNNELKALGLLAEEQIQSEVLRREDVANRIRVYASLIVQADRAWQMGNMERCQELLSQCPEKLRNWEWTYLRQRLHVNQSVIRASGFKARQVAYRPDGKMLASAGGKLEDVDQDGVIKIWDPVTRKLLFELTGQHKGPVTWLAFHPNNRWLISLSLRMEWGRVIKDSDPAAFDTADGECVLWSLDEKKCLLKVPGLFDVGALSSDGALFAAAGRNRETRIWRLDAKEPWKEAAQLPVYPGSEVRPFMFISRMWQEVAKLPACIGLVKKLAFSPDDKLLARSGILIRGIERGEMKFTPELKLFRISDGSEERILPIPHVEVETVAFAPDGRSLAWSNGVQNSVTLWDLQGNRALRSFYGHAASVQTLAFNKNGSMLASGGSDRLIKIWDVESGKELRTLRGHDVSVDCLAFAPNNLKKDQGLVSSGGDGTVRFWNPEIGQEPLTLGGHMLAVTQALFSPDGKSIASRGAGGVVRLWDATSGQFRFELSCGAERMAWSPDSKWLLTGGGDHRAVEKPGELIVWEAATGKPVRTLTGHKRYVLAVAWSPDGAHFISVDGNPFTSPNQTGEMIVWNSATFAKENSWTPPIGCVGDIAYSPDGAQLAVSSFDKNLYLLDPVSGELMRTLSGHEQPVYRLAYSRDGSRLASGDMSGIVYIWNVASGRLEQTIRAAVESIGGLCFNARGDRLATASFDRAYRDLGMIKLWDVRSGQEVCQLPGQQTVHFSPDDRRLAVASPGNFIQPGAVHVLDSNPNAEIAVFSTGGIVQLDAAIAAHGRRLAVANADTQYNGRVSLFDWSTRREIVALLSSNDNLVTKVAFDPSNDNRLTTGHKSGQVLIWDIQRRKAIHTIHAHVGLVMRVLYSPDGRTIATTGQDKTIKLWDAATGTPIVSWEAHNQKINDLAFSPDGTKLASASGDKSVRIWSCADQREIRRFELSAEGTSVGWSNDGTLLAAGGNFRDILVWDPESGVLRQTLVGHQGSVWSLSFSPNGKWLASGGSDQTVRIWNAETGQANGVHWGHFDLVRSVAFHPHLPLLMSASYDLSIRIWRISNGTSWQ